MKLNIPVDSIEGKYLTPDLRKKINGSEQVVNNYITNNQITNINGVIKAKCVSTTNISLNDTTTVIDGYTCLENDIILVAGQTDKTENGVYRYDTSFIRYDFEAGEIVAVLNGTNYSNSLWKNSNNELVIGTTLIDFQQKFDIDNNVTVNGILFDNSVIANNDLGFLSWDTNAETLTLNLKNDTKLQLGQEMYYHVKNVQGATITNGQMVYAFGTSGNSGNINVKLGTADGSINSRYFLGIATQDILDNDFGFITYFGLVRGVQTNGANYGETWNDGDVLYVSPTVAGGLTNIRPISPNLHIIVAMVIHSHSSNGALFVRVDNGLLLGDLHDVYTNGVNDGDVLTWNDTNNRFEMMPVESLPAGTVNQTLRHDGTDWVANDLFQATSFGGIRIFGYGTGGNNMITLYVDDVATFRVEGSGKIASASLTASALMQSNSSQEIISIADGSNGQFLKTNGAGTYSFANPNTIKYNTALISDTLGNWTNVPTLTFSLEANVIYELELYLSLGNNAGRNGSIRIDTSSAAYIHRPFIIGNSNGANPAVIYINDSTATQPFNLDNSTELQVQNADSGSIVMLKGIITSTINIPMATIQIKTRDIGSAFQCKEYSYLKISR